MATKVSIICVGNECRNDDGFGPAVARYLSDRYMFPPDVEVRTCWELGHPVVGDLMTCEAAVLVGAVDGSEGAPGTMDVFAPDDETATANRHPLHGGRIADVWSNARFLGSACAEARCYGVHAQDVEGGAPEGNLSAPVAAAVAPCAREVVQYLAKTYWHYATDLWQATADPRAVLDDPAPYVHAALAGRGAGELEDAVLARVGEAGPLADYQVDELIDQMLAAC